MCIKGAIVITHVPRACSRKDALTSGRLRLEDGIGQELSAQPHLHPAESWCLLICLFYI